MFLKGRKLIAGALCLMFVLASCGPATGGGTTAAPAANQPPQPAEAPTVTVEFWDLTWGPPDFFFPAVDANVERFNAENTMGIYLDLQRIPWDAYTQVFLTAVAGGAAPDASTGGSARPIGHADMGVGLPLCPIVDQWRAENHPILNDFLPGVLDHFNMDGIQWGIPWNMDTRVLIYRTDIFEEAGITDYPRNFDEFREVLRTIKQTHPDIIPFTVALGDAFANTVAISWLFYNRAPFADPIAEVGTLTSPEAFQVWNFFQELFEEGLIAPGTGGYRGADVELLYTSGEVAITMNVPPLWLSGTPMYDVSGILPPIAGPNAGNEGSLNVIWVNGIMGYNVTPHPDETRYFIRWWAENTLNLFIDGHMGPFPVRSSFYQEPEFADSWVRSQVYDRYLADRATPVSWPLPNMYPAFAIIEAEGYHGNVLRATVTGGDVEAIAEQMNDLMTAAFE